MCVSLRGGESGGGGWDVVEHQYKSQVVYFCMSLFCPLLYTSQMYSQQYIIYTLSSKAAIQINNALN